MLELLLWLCITGPLTYIRETKSYLLGALIFGVSRKRWELEEEIRSQYKLLTYFENCASNDPSKAEIFEDSCDKIITEIKRLKSLRDGNKQVKILS